MMNSIEGIFERIQREVKERKSQKDPFVIAIDGRAASGKTTLAGLLSERMDASLVHMDDFFLPPQLRKEERYAVPGGNIHIERFKEEVLPFLSQRGTFSYRRFDCHRMAYTERITVKDAPFRIVEGSYSQHPSLGKYADLTIFLSVSPKLQEARILKRNGEEMARRFREKWIPLEESYFAHFHVEENADLVIEEDENS